MGAQIHITMTAATLAGTSDTPGRLPGGGVVPAALARRIACQPTSTWYRLLTDPTGRLLDLSATGYRPSAPLSRAVSVLHPTCIAPGCTRPALGCELDHETPWPAGPTDLGNLSPKCKSHHTAKTAGRLHSAKDADGAVTWTYPTGHTYTTRPPRHPVDHWPQHWVEPDSQHQVQQALAALQRETDRRNRDDITELQHHVLDQRLARWEAQTPPDPWPDRHGEHHECEPSYEEYTATRPTLQVMLS